jgi:SOS-response transcriptional repressor LexA
MTELHRRTLDFILQFWARAGYAPSYEDIRLGIGVKSKSSVHSLLSRMSSRGLITMLPRKARSIKVVQNLD